MTPAFKGVPLDWRGTLVVAPTYPWLVSTALPRAGRDASPPAGVKVGVVSDIHVDIRPAFAAHADQDGETWADLVDVWALSFEIGVAKPDPAIFETALDRLGMPAADVLMVGDRRAWDGAAASVGITTLLLPPLRSPGELRLHRVLDLVLPARPPVLD